MCPKKRGDSLIVEVLLSQITAYMVIGDLHQYHRLSTKKRNNMDVCCLIYSMTEGSELGFKCL
jgi:hypothetical protein